MNIRNSTLIRSTAFSALSAAVLFIVGCDEPASPPPPATAPALPAPTPHARPTTQALVEGKWKTVPISALPLTISVPDSWEAQPVSGSRLFLMEGFTPNGYVSLSLASRPQLAKDKVADFIAAAKKRLDEKGPKKLRFDSKEYPDFTALERLYFEDREAMLLRNDRGELIEREAQPMKWSYLIFLKNETMVDLYELEFNDLSLDHYEKDREFLQRILGTLTNDPGKKS